MKILLALIKKNFKLLIRSKFSVLIILIGPLLIMLLTGLVFNNTNVYNINIGVFSEEYTEIIDSFIEKLKVDQFTVLKTISKDACINKIEEGNFHICIIFPGNITLNQESQNQIIFYVDYSRINLVWMVIDTISTKISERSSELSLNLTMSVIDALKEIELELSDKMEIINGILNNTKDSSTELESIKVLLDSMDLSFDDNDFNIESLLSKNDELESLSHELRTYSVNKTEESIDLMEDIATEIESLNITSSERSDLNTLISQIKSSLETLKENIIDKDNSVSNVSDQISTSLDTVSENLDSLKSKLSLVSIERLEIFTKITTIKDKLNISKFSLVEWRASIQKIHNIFYSIQVKDATMIVNPTTTIIKPITTEKSHLNYFFPSLISLVIMFIAMLLGSSLVMMEKTSRAHFRDFISPTDDIVFFFSTYLTCMIIMFIQLIILFIISLLVFDIPISIFSSNFLSIIIISLIITTLFTILGMLIGYLFKSRETATLGAISLSSIFFIISDLILPIESIPRHLLFLAKLNPFMVSGIILKKAILFNKNFFSLGNSLYLLLFYIILFFVISIILIGFLKKKYFIAIHSKLIRKKERQKKHK